MSPDGTLKENFPSSFVTVVVLAFFSFSVAEITPFFDVPSITVPEICRICASINNGQRHTHRAVSSNLFIIVVLW